MLLFILTSFLYADEVGKDEKKNKPRLVTIPTLSADKSKGAGVGLLSMYFFKLSADKDTPLSRVGLAANTTTVGNYTVVLFQQIFTKNDDWRISAAEILANSNFQTYVASARSDSSIVVPYNNYFEMVFLNISRRMFWKNFYIGPQVTIGTADTTFEPEGSKEVFTKESLNS
jgi:hypothetical protein